MKYKDKLSKVQLKQKIIHLQAESKRYLKKLNEYEANYHFYVLKELKNDKKQLEEEVKKLKKERDQANNEKDQLVNQLKSLQKTNEHSSNELDIYRETLDELKLANDEKDKKIVQLFEEVHKMKSKLKSLEEKLKGEQSKRTRVLEERSKQEKNQQLTISRLENKIDKLQTTNETNRVNKKQSTGSMRRIENHGEIHPVLRGLISNFPTFLSERNTPFMTNGHTSPEVNKEQRSVKRDHKRED
ncbi:hypothetical protein LGQ02_13870 [Bacillus shivajii]|uniref:hypothetical protein n=1 Tax=Bacillus shivajii TaxID=1983719 RepID=UPI001CF98293|nr:hypothetical protein [Bacillus shivajii]UCZ51938.1 hypothetical protein LGQ02_13870 [Bacillus shivajii]